MPSTDPESASGSRRRPDRASILERSPPGCPPRGPPRCGSAGRCCCRQPPDPRRSRRASKHAGIVVDPVAGGSSTCLRCHSAEVRVVDIQEAISQGLTPDQVDAAILKLTPDQLKAYAPITHESASCGTCHDPHRNTANLTS